MIQAIIFDLYGVLALNGWQAFKSKHFTGREDIWDAVFQLGRQVDAGLADYDELVRFTAEQSGEGETTVRYQLEHTLANDDLLSYLAHELKPTYSLGILSNTSHPEVIGQIFTPEQQALFSDVTLSRHHGSVKPDPEIFELSAEKLGLMPSQCLFVDDLERHVNGARAAGMQALVYRDFEQFKADLKGLLS